MANLLDPKLAFEFVQPVPPKRLPAHYVWAELIARIYDLYPLLSPISGGHMRQLLLLESLQNVPPDWSGKEGPFKKI